MFQKQIASRQELSAAFRTCTEENNPVFNRVNIPGMLFTRSPQKLVPNLMHLKGKRPGTPGRNGRADPSPLSRQYDTLKPNHSRGEENILSVPRYKMLNTVQCEPLTFRYVCVSTNHKNKPATFLVIGDGEQMPYCQKCAILLASQGFTVSKLQNSSPQLLLSHQQPTNIHDIRDPKRKEEIKSFLTLLDQTILESSRKGLELSLSTQTKQSYWSRQEQTINNYFSNLKDILQQQRIAVIEQLRSIEPSQQEQQRQITKLKEDCQAMRKDIQESPESINNAKEDMFSSIMGVYRNKLREEKNRVCVQVQPTMSKRVEVGGIKQAEREILKIIDVKLKDSEPSNIKKSMHFSFDNDMDQQNLTIKSVVKDNSCVLEDVLNKMQFD